MCRSWILAIIDFKETWLNIIKFTRELQKHVDLLTKMTRLDQPFDEYCNTSTVYTYFASEAVAIYLPQRREISWAPLLVGVILVFILFSSVDSMYIQFNFFWSGQDRYISDAMPCQEQICQGLSGKWCFWEVLKVTITYYNHLEPRRSDPWRQFIWTHSPFKTVHVHHEAQTLHRAPMFAVQLGWLISGVNAYRHLYHFISYIYHILYMECMANRLPRHP